MTEVFPPKSIQTNLNAGYYVSYLLYREYTNPIYKKTTIIT